jgi:hypothetical protein
MVAECDARAAWLVALRSPSQWDVFEAIVSDSEQMSQRHSLRPGSPLQIQSQEAVLRAVGFDEPAAGPDFCAEVWPDLAAVLIVQWAAGSSVHPASHTAAQRRWMIRGMSDACRGLLAASPDRPALVPDSRLLDAMAEFSAGAGHEINNPLGSIIAQSQLLLKTEAAVSVRQGLESIIAQAWRIRDMIGQAMLFARPPEPRESAISVTHLAETVLASLRAAASEAGVELRLDSNRTELPLNADSKQLSVLLANLIRNASDAASTLSGPRFVDVKITDGHDGSALVSVASSSCEQLSNEERRHLFNPYFSGRGAGRGLGFGLCHAWQIVRQHQGILWAEVGADGRLWMHAALPGNAVMGQGV